jgi:hypothetical protein
VVALKEEGLSFLVVIINEEGRTAFFLGRYHQCHLSLSVLVLLLHLNTALICVLDFESVISKEFFHKTEFSLLSPDKIR